MLSELVLSTSVYTSVRSKKRPQTELQYVPVGHFPLSPLTGVKVDYEVG
jgi:hypothetical protein